MDFPEPAAAYDNRNEEGKDDYGGHNVEEGSCHHLESWGFPGSSLLSLGVPGPWYICLFGGARGSRTILGVESVACFDVAPGDVQKDLNC